MAHLRQLLGEGELSPSYGSQDPDDAASSSDDDGRDGNGPRSMPGFSQRPEDAIDDAENPLQLLARASYFQPSESRQRQSPQQPRHHATTEGTISRPESPGLQDFFTSAHVNLDIGEDIDPISLGLVTEEEAESLFSLYVAFARNRCLLLRHDADVRTM